MKINNVKNEFPIFKKKINGKNLIYLDSANSSQKPQSVINRMSYFYENEFSNVGRSVHTLAVEATNAFENTRDLVEILKTQVFQDAFILIKGSRGMKLEQLVDYL